MRKKLAAALCCLLLMVQMAPPPAQAASGYICFMAAGESILPMSDSTMPFWQDGYLYIASSIFTGSVRDTLNIGRIANSDQVILYTSGKSLWFEYGSSTAHDTDGNIYTPGAVRRNGETYVPAGLVAQFFGLQYSVTNVRITVDGETVEGDLAWIRRPGYGLTPEMFANAASFTMASRYADYLREQREQEETTVVTPEPSPGVEVDGKRIYLCLEAGEDTAALLDVLDRYDAQAAFFCTVEFLEEQGDLLRRMAAGGQSIAILVDASDTERSVAEQLAAGNAALELATCGKTRLCFVQNSTAESLREAQAAGYRCLEADLDRSGYELRGSSSAASLLQGVSARRGDVTVWLGSGASGLGLQAFLSAAAEADGQCVAWTETA